MSTRTQEYKKTRMLVACMVITCTVLFMCSGCRQDSPGRSKKTEFEIDNVYERGPLTVHVRLDKTKMTIAETVLLELEAAVGQGYEVKMPKVDKVLENFGIVDWDNPGDRLDANDNVVSTYRYRLEPFLSGNYEIPAFTFVFHDINEVEAKHELSSEPIEVEVASLLGEQRKELVIADIEDVVEMPKKASLWWVWVVSAACIMTAGGGWFYLRRKRAAELIRILKPAHEIAYARLQALVKDNLINAGRIKEFYERISDILRHYIEHRFDLRAPERTTEEFLIEIQSTHVLSQSNKDALGEFLQHCDLVKFAKHRPTREQIQRTFDLAKNFIEKTKSDERKIDVTNKVEIEEPVEVGSA
jgi:hypothetical protein